jgi:hypothetical protein
MLCIMQAWWGYDLNDFLRAILRYDLRPYLNKMERKFLVYDAEVYGDFTEDDMQSLASFFNHPLNELSKDLKC